MAESNRKSRLAIVEETTEGTLVLPTSASQYIALQDGFSLVPNFELVDNAELKSSIGVSAPIQGSENPTVELSHYMRHSHVEGTAPNFGQLLEAAFGETVAFSGSQRATTAASTAGTSSAAAVIKLAAGGTDYERGKAVLIKDGTNNYSIRPVKSVATNDLTLGFNLAAAPASGISVGKPVFYKPNDVPPSLSYVLYRANGADVEAVAGAKISEFSMDATAGEALNSSFSAEGIKYFFNPVEITASTKYLDFLDNATTRVATLTVKVYRDQYELAQAVQDAMNSLGSANTFTVTYNPSGASAGKYTIASNGATLTLKWNTGTNTANSIASKLGFSTAADSSAALTYDSTTVASYASPQTPSLDAGQPLLVKNMEVMIGDFADYGCSGAQSFSFSMANEVVRVPDICSESGFSGTVNNKRTVTCDAVLTLTKHDSEKFKNFRAGDTVSFGFNFGTKSGGNWEAGKCGNLYMPDCKITAYEVSDNDGIVVINLTVQAFVDTNGYGEVYLTFL